MQGCGGLRAGEGGLCRRMWGGPGQVRGRGGMGVGDTDLPGVQNRSTLGQLCSLRLGS